MKHLAFLSLSFSLCLAACGSTSEGGNGSGDPNTSSGTGLCGTNATSITYSGQAQAVFNASCVSGCHTTGGTESSLPLDSLANAEATLKANGGAGIVDSGAMPPSGSPSLTANQKCIIDNWVSGGYPQ